MLFFVVVVVVFVCLFGGLLCSVNHDYQREMAQLGVGVGQ